MRGWSTSGSIGCKAASGKLRQLRGAPDRQAAARRRSGPCPRPDVEAPTRNKRCADVPTEPPGGAEHASRPPAQLQPQRPQGCGTGNVHGAASVVQRNHACSWAAEPARVPPTWRRRRRWLRRWAIRLHKPDRAWKMDNLLETLPWSLWLRRMLHWIRGGLANCCAAARIPPPAAPSAAPLPCRHSPGPMFAIARSIASSQIARGTPRRRAWPAPTRARLVLGPPPAWRCPARRDALLIN